MEISFGPQVLGDLEVAAQREWLVTDGLGGYAMGTIAGLATRRYHGLLMVATEPPRRRHLALASLDPVLVMDGRSHELATHEWAGGAVVPSGHRQLGAFSLIDGVPRWRWVMGDVVLERELAMVHRRPAVGVVFRLLRAPGPVRLELNPLCTWRDSHGERVGSSNPDLAMTADGFLFEGLYRVRGPGFRPEGHWYRGWHHREEAARGLNPEEDVYSPGRFIAELNPGTAVTVEAWADDPSNPPSRAEAIVEAARARFRSMGRAAADDIDRLLLWAAAQFVVEGPAVVAGYPWFGDWSRDTMTSYEGLFLETGRVEEGRRLLEASAGLLSQGMLANTADTGATEYNTVDATPWFLHAVGRHVGRTGDLDLADGIFPSLEAVIDHHLTGTRYGIRVDDDGLITQGAPGVALTWMDARVDGFPITPRFGKPVEVNALWVSGLAGLTRMGRRLHRRTDRIEALWRRAGASFARRYPAGLGLSDVVDGPDGDDPSLRPNQLLAVSLPDAPLSDPRVPIATTPLVTPLGLRSLGPADPGFIGHHRGGPRERDRAYHQGTVWPWLMGPYVEACLRTGIALDGVLAGLEAHLGEWGLGSVSETADGIAPHHATGCPFQAWSVAEVLRARRLLQR